MTYTVTRVAFPPAVIRYGGQSHLTAGIVWISLGVGRNASKEWLDVGADDRARSRQNTLDVMYDHDDGPFFGLSITHLK